MLNFTTFFDFNYLSKGIVLYNSIHKQVKAPFKLYLLCLDNNTLDFFSHNKKDFEFIEVISMKDFESDDPSLLFAKQNRSLVEYYFTLSPVLPLYLFKKYNLDHICSMDADLYFYSSPQSIFEKLQEYSIIITPHKFTKELSNREKFGLYNVSFQLFKNNKIGIECLTQWKNECIEWCGDHFDEANNRFADQKYLDSWKDKFKNEVLILDGHDTGLAIWNINNYKLNFTNDMLNSNDTKVIFYHFHNFKSITNTIVLNGFYDYKVKRNYTLDSIYQQYWNEINKIIKRYNLNIDNSIRGIKKTFISKLLDDCTFYYFNNNKHMHYNLKYIPKIIRKIYIKLHG